ncbi:hypothetical protein [Devosia sp.]|uniref:hypothetical protein n=1 Tax=Devosia sp. TaxID=1871048 RepID=UPI001B149ACC|nr:hypothetical protein [Devosia sp.]MBO9588587.1 hypothetical protein [Devosia sp.]
MSIFSLLKKAPSPAGQAGDLSPEGEVSLRDGEPPHLSLRGRGRREAAGEGALATFSEKNCAIWNDIQRALESK